MKCDNLCFSNCIPELCSLYSMHNPENTKNKMTPFGKGQNPKNLASKYSQLNCKISEKIQNCHQKFCFEPVACCVPHSELRVGFKMMKLQDTTKACARTVVWKLGTFPLSRRGSTRYFLDEGCRRDLGLKYSQLIFPIPWTVLTVTMGDLSKQRCLIGDWVMMGSIFIVIQSAIGWGTAAVTFAPFCYPFVFPSFCSGERKCFLQINNGETIFSNCIVNRETVLGQQRNCFLWKEAVVYKRRETRGFCHLAFYCTRHNMYWTERIFKGKLNT